VFDRSISMAGKSEAITPASTKDHRRLTMLPKEEKTKYYTYSLKTVKKIWALIL